jgi:hypothetical protein
MSNFGLPHELLMRKYELSINDLPVSPRQFKMDLEKILTMIINKSKNGQIQMTEATKTKIEAYDRAICDGIFAYLDDEEIISESQADKEESNLDDIREKAVEKINDAPNSSDNKTSTTTSNPNVAINTPSSNESTENKAKIGFWDWQ